MKDKQKTQIEERLINYFTSTSDLYKRNFFKEILIEIQKNEKKDLYELIKEKFEEEKDKNRLFKKFLGKKNSRAAHCLFDLFKLANGELPNAVLIKTNSEFLSMLNGTPPKKCLRILPKQPLKEIKVEIKLTPEKIYRAMQVRAQNQIKATINSALPNIIDKDKILFFEKIFSEIKYGDPYDVISGIFKQEEDITLLFDYSKDIKTTSIALRADLESLYSGTEYMKDSPFAHCLFDLFKLANFELLDVKPDRESLMTNRNFLNMLKGECPTSGETKESIIKLIQNHLTSGSTLSMENIIKLVQQEITDLEKAKLNSTGIFALYNKQQDLVTACEEGDIKKVKKLLDSKAEPDIATREGKHPLAAAIWGNNFAITELLESKTKHKMSETQYIEHNKKYYLTLFKFKPKATTPAKIPPLEEHRPKTRSKTTRSMRTRSMRTSFNPILEIRLFSGAEPPIFLQKIESSFSKKI